MREQSSSFKNKPNPTPLEDTFPERGFFCSYAYPVQGELSGKLRLVSRAFDGEEGLGLMFEESGTGEGYVRRLCKEGFSGCSHGFLT